MNHQPEADLLREVVAHLKAGRWTTAHDLVQQVDSTAASWLHGIVHIQEGDLEDAEYWYERPLRAGSHSKQRICGGGDVGIGRFFRTRTLVRAYEPRPAVDKRVGVGRSRTLL